MKRRLSSPTSRIPSKAAAPDYQDVFPLLPIKNYQKVTEYTQPSELGSFCYDAERKCNVGDRSKLYYYWPPQIPSDLNYGFPEKFIKPEPKPERLDALLLCLKDINSKKDVPHVPNFCTCTWWLTQGVV
jgi:hypothetical protein